MTPVRQLELLRFEEIARLVRLFAQMGVNRVRLTGGEPTIRKNLCSLVKQIRGIEGIEEVAMTTNAHLLDAMAKPLAKAGLSSVNVSLDTLDPGPFAQLTVRGNIARVIRGIEAAVDAGLRVSTNAVAIKGVNDKQLLELCEFAWQRGVSPRFIEAMPMSEGDAFSAADLLTALEIRTSIEQSLQMSLTPIGIHKSRGPAQYWKVGESENRFGIISAMSENFCSTCNRVRMSATGHLHTCLAHDDTVDLRELVRSGAGDAKIKSAIVTALSLKRDGHIFQQSGSGGPRKHMISIGG